MASFCFPLSFVVIGASWRAGFFARIARQFPHLFDLKYVYCRSAEKAAQFAGKYHVPVTVSMEDCVKMKPDFVVIAVSVEAAFPIIKFWTDQGAAVLTETPAAATLDELKALWDLKEQGARIQVAEQYHRYPIVAAGLDAIARGWLGETYAVNLSLCHGYHGVSLIRRMLGVAPAHGGNVCRPGAGMGSVPGEVSSAGISGPCVGPHTGMFGKTVRLRGAAMKFPVTQTDSRSGPVTDGSVQTQNRDLVMFEFENGKTALYDFSGVQYHSFIRARHLNVQGSRGEWNDSVLRMVGADNRPVKTELRPYLNPRYREVETEKMREIAGRWNPTLAMENEQDEYAIATMMYDMKAYLEEGAEVYPLAEALEDAYLAQLMRRALAQPWQEVCSERMPWHEGGQS